jgi:elongation factor G
MHADKMEDIESADAGSIVALFGIECSSGDTFTDGTLHYAMSSMHVPEPVISLAIYPKENTSQVNISKALNRFTKEDPTFRVTLDEDTGDTIISGMGELHLDIYVERMKREYTAEVETGMPKVAYKETISKMAQFDYTHKKQTGGAGQYARVAGWMEPYEEGDYHFVNQINVNQIKGGAIPTEYIPSCDKGFRACLKKGELIGAPIVGIQITINDGQHHPVDSSDIAFQQAGIGAFRSAYKNANPTILEPVMKVAIEGPSEFQGNILASIHQRRGVIISTLEDGVFSTVEAEVPLAEMFGYSTTLRSMTQGKAEFSMEFTRYSKVPPGIADELKKKSEEEKK